MTSNPVRLDPVSAVALLDEPTRRRLYEVVAASDEPVGRDRAATGAGVSRELAAFHLDRLTEAGLLEAVYRRLGSKRGPGAGRPAKLYRRAARDVAVSLPPRDYRRAAEILETAIDDVADPAVLTAIAAAAHDRGAVTGAAAKAASRPRSERRRREALVELLVDGGYEPVVDAVATSIRLRNCPYHDLAQRHRDITCGMNLAWANGVVEGLGLTDVEPVLAPEPGACCVVFADADGDAPRGEARQSPDAGPHAA
jgi:predicted ArsR family transcriptional regulator